MKMREDLTGRTFGKLTVVGFSHSRKETYWKCLCECGKAVTVVRGNLVRRTKSCGCLIKQSVTKHGTFIGSRGGIPRLYRIWGLMLHRTRNKNARAAANYSQRGITVCAEWSDYAAFRDWALSNGYRSDLTLDREDNDGNYEPANCRWATRKEQNNNTRRNVWVDTPNGKMTLTQAARDFNITRWKLKDRLNKGINPFESETRVLTDSNTRGILLDWILDFAKKKLGLR